MRPSLALVVLVLPVTGCSALVANTGEKPETLGRVRAREIAEAEPVETATENGDLKCTFRTKRKIADPDTAARNIERYMNTFGLSELVYFPWQFLDVMRTALFGSAVEICTSTQHGWMETVYVNGRRVYGSPP